MHSQIVDYVIHRLNIFGRTLVNLITYKWMFGSILVVYNILAIVTEAEGKG